MGYIRLPETIFERLAELSSAAVKVAAALGRHANLEGASCPGLALLATETGLTKRGVQGGLTQLKALGVLSNSIHRGRRKNDYQWVKDGLPIPSNWTARGESACTSKAQEVQGGSPQRRTAVHREVNGHASRGEPACTHKYPQKLPQEVTVAPAASASPPNGGGGSPAGTPTRNTSEVQGTSEAGVKTAFDEANRILRYRREPRKLPMMAGGSR